MFFECNDFGMSSEQGLPNLRDDVLFQANSMKMDLVDRYGNIVEKVNVDVEAIKSNSTLRLCIIYSNTHDQMLTSVIDETTYCKIKEDQSLNVSFQEFIDWIKNFLENCLTDQMEMRTVKGENNYALHFVEVRRFRCLVHVMLPIKSASKSTIIVKMKETMSKYEREVSNYKSEVNCLKHEISQREAKIEELKSQALTMTREIEYERNFLQEREEKMLRTNDEQRHNFESEILKLRNCIKILNRKNFTARKEIRCYVKENEKLLEKVKNFQIREENVQGELRNQQILLTEYKQNQIQLTAEIEKLQENLRAESKIKANLEAELDAEKKICSLKKASVQVATEEVMKADETISKLMEDITKLKRDINLKTQIALQQEAILQQKEKQALVQNNEMHKLGRKLKRLQIPMDNCKSLLDFLQEFSVKIFARLEKRI